MLATLPMDRQHNLACLLIDVSNDFLHEGTKQLLACAHGDAGRVPHSGKILGKSAEVRAGCSRQRSLSRVQALLAQAHAMKCSLPALLELGGDQAIVGIARSVATLCE